MSEATVRQASDVDVAALVALRRRSREEDTGPIDDPDFESRWRRWYEQQRAHRVFFIAELDGEPIGTTNLLIYDRMPTPGQPAGQWGYLANMYVAAEHRDRGIGSQLMTALLDHARGLALDRVVLSPTQRSIPFYERGGFRPAHDLLVQWFDRD